MLDEDDEAVLVVEVVCEAVVEVCPFEADCMDEDACVLTTVAAAGVDLGVTGALLVLD